MCGITASITIESPPSSHRSTAATAATNGDSAHYPRPLSDTARRDTLESDLHASLEKIAHRGPDAQGVWTSSDGHVGLAHCRLAINDLSPSGTQPFHSPPSNSSNNSTIHAVVNGELYDADRIRASLASPPFHYTFQGTSDCEIVIALYQVYGQSFLHHLRGEFALVLYDEERRLFLAARDRYGIKPLFWTLLDGDEGDKEGGGGERGRERRLLVSAEAKGFLPLGWRPEWDVKALVDAGWGHDTRTVFKGVQKLRPGHYMTCTPLGTAGSIESRPYWDIEYPDKYHVETRTEEEMVQGVRERLLEAIRLRLRADVPVGIYLSGGIDSSVIAGMATHLVRERGMQMGSQDAKDRICCFSIGFDEEGGFDESDISNRTAEWLGVKYLKKHMDEEELASRLEDATYHIEHHNHDLGYVGKFALSESVREYGYKVVLTGEGADENFGGYPLYQADFLRESDPSWPAQSLNTSPKRRSALQASTETTITSVYKSIGALAPAPSPVASAQITPLTTTSSMLAFNPPLSLFSSWVNSAYSKLDPALTIADNVPNNVKPLIQSRWHPLHSAQYIWTKGHLANNFLSCLGDRTEMAHSVEARTPFLDHVLTEYVNQIPPSLKIKYDPPSPSPAPSTTTNGHIVSNGDAPPSSRESPSIPHNNSNNNNNTDHDTNKGEQDTGTLTEKHILRAASAPFITPELLHRRKHAYAAPTLFPAHGPLHALFTRLLTKANVDALGFVAWDAVERNLADAFDASVEEGGRTRAFRLGLVVLQWVVLGKRVGVRRAVGVD